MADDYKASPAWQALNRIWKSIPAREREAVRDDFRLLTDMVREKGDLPPAEVPKTVEYDFENRYLDGMSKATKSYALGYLMRERTDVYQKITAYIVAGKIRDMDSLWDGYAAENEIAAESEAAVREIMCVCLERARIQGLV